MYGIVCLRICGLGYTCIALIVCCLPLPFTVAKMAYGTAIVPNCLHRCFKRQQKLCICATVIAELQGETKLVTSTKWSLTHLIKVYTSFLFYDRDALTLHQSVIMLHQSFIQTDTLGMKDKEVVLDILRSVATVGFTISEAQPLVRGLGVLGQTDNFSLHQYHILQFLCRYRRALWNLSTLGFNDGQFLPRDAL